MPVIRTIPFQQCRFWGYVSRVVAAVFCWFQGRNLLGDEQNFKREDVKKRRGRSDCPAHHRTVYLIFSHTHTQHTHTPFEIF